MFRLIFYAHFLLYIILINACLPTIKLCKTDNNSILSFPYDLTVISVDGQIIADIRKEIISDNSFKGDTWVEKFTIYQNKANRLCLDPGRHFLEVRFERMMKGSVYIDFDAIAGHEYKLHSEHRVSPVHNFTRRDKIGPESSFIPLTLIESWSLQIVDQADERVIVSTDKLKYNYGMWTAKGIRARGCGNLDVSRVRSPWQILLPGIACPAEGQSFEKGAREFTQNLIYNKELTIHPVKIWHDTMVTARVDVDGKSLTEELLKNGLAWVDPRYQHAEKLMKFEEYARNNKIGIWSEPGPMPPWIYKDLADGREKALNMAQKYSRSGDQSLKLDKLLDAETWYDKSLELNRVLNNLVGMAEQYEKLLNLCKTRGILKEGKEEERYRETIERLRTMGQQQQRGEKTHPTDDAFIQELQKKLKRITFGECR